MRHQIKKNTKIDTRWWHDCNMRSIVMFWNDYMTSSHKTVSRLTRGSRTVPRWAWISSWLISLKFRRCLSNFRAMCSFEDPTSELRYPTLSIHTFDFCSEHGILATVISATFQNDWATQKWIKGKRDLPKFGFKMRFGRISFVAQSPGCKSKFNHIKSIRYHNTNI